jgi:hypothetical protein
LLDAQGEQRAVKTLEMAERRMKASAGIKQNAAEAVE